MLACFVGHPVVLLLFGPCRAMPAQEGEEAGEQQAAERVSDEEVQGRLQHIPPQLWQRLYK